MTVQDDRLTCDSCGRETSVDNDYDWGALEVRPKGILVHLDLCGACVEARLPKPPLVKPDPTLKDCLNSLHVAAFLLWQSGEVDEIHLSTRRSSFVTVKPSDDRWRVMEIYENTSRGRQQLSKVIERLSYSYSLLWDDSEDYLPLDTVNPESYNNLIERVKWCCQEILDGELWH